MQLSILVSVFILSSIALFVKKMWPEVKKIFTKNGGRALEVDDIAEITGLMFDAYSKFTEE